MESTVKNLRWIFNILVVVLGFETWHISQNVIFWGALFLLEFGNKITFILSSAVKTSKRPAMDPIPKNKCSDIVYPNKTHTKFTHRTCLNVGTHEQSRTQMFEFLTLRHFMYSNKNMMEHLDRNGPQVLDFMVPFFSNLAPYLGFRACLAKVRQRTADQWQLRLCTLGLQTSTVECLARSPERPEEWKHDLYSCLPASVYPIWESSWHDN